MTVGYPCNSPHRPGPSYEAIPVITLRRPVARHWLECSFYHCINIIAYSQNLSSPTDETKNPREISGDASRSPDLACVGCGAWTRTKIDGFKGRCPTIRRPRKTLYLTNYSFFCNASIMANSNGNWVIGEYFILVSASKKSLRMR